MSVFANTAGDGPFDFFFYDTDGDVWDTSTETYVAPYDADITKHRVVATETSAGSGRWVPDEVPAGAASFELRAQAATIADSYVVFSETISAAASGAFTQSIDITEQEVNLG